MPTVAITGAYGYLGGLVRADLASQGWETVALVRSPRPGDRARPFTLGEAYGPELLADVDLLIHCAYDMSLTQESEIWDINVRGTDLLLRAWKEASVKGLIVVSSMSAYSGTRQLYGRAKLAIEALTSERGGWIVRPGLVIGDPLGGMAASLAKLSKLPVVPLLGGSARQFPVAAEDLLAVMSALATSESSALGPIGVAQAAPVSLPTLLTALSDGGRKGPGRTVPVPWRAVYGALKVGERLPVKLPFRADSVLGLVFPAPQVEGAELLDDLGIPRPRTVVA